MRRQPQADYLEDVEDSELNYIAGTIGDDTIAALGEGSSIFGDRGNDLILGGVGRDGLSGGDGNDTLFGGGGLEWLLGGAAPVGDAIEGGRGQDWLYGFGVCSLYGGDGADHLFGGYGGYGWSRMDGGNGNDYFDVGEYISGRQVLAGGSGVDLADFSKVTIGYEFVVRPDGFVVVGSSDRVALYSIERLIGTQGDDHISGGPDVTLLDGSGGNDFVWGDHIGASTIRGGAGNDTIGGSGACRLYGGSGRDSLTAGGVYTSSGTVDWLFGGEGRDTLVGGAGEDVLRGDGGADFFVIDGSGGQDQIRDFRADIFGEVIKITSSLGISDFDDLMAHHMIEVGGSAVIQYLQGSVWLNGVQVSNLSADDFLFE